MKIKYSALVSDARGKLNGSVASKNRYGNYLRNKVTPTNPQTTAQMQYRSLFGSISKNWGLLTQEERLSWDALAEQHPFNDIFGDSKILQGSAMYQKCNMNIAKIDMPLLDVPGEALNMPGITDLKPTMTTGTNGTIEDVRVNAIFADEAVDGMFVVVYATPPITAGRSFVKNDFRLIHTEAATDGEINLDMAITTQYIEKFGNSLKPNRKVFARVALVDSETGLQSPAWEAVFQ